MKQYPELKYYVGIISGFIQILYTLTLMFSISSPRLIFPLNIIFEYCSPLTFLSVSLFVGCVLCFFYTIAVDSAKIKGTAMYKNHIIDDFRDIDKGEWGLYVFYKKFSLITILPYIIVRIFVYYPVLLICISIHKLYLFFMNKFTQE